MINGPIHSIGLLQVITKEYGIFHLRDGTCHRDDGPALICPNGSQYWYRDGEMHRDDGPAIIQSDGLRVWYQKGRIHRSDGPAIIYPNGISGYYCNGIPISKDEFEERTR